MNKTPYILELMLYGKLWHSSSPNTHTHGVSHSFRENCQNGSKYGRRDLLATPSSVTVVRKAEVTAPCTRVHVGEGTTSHSQEGNHPGKTSKPQASQAPTQELCSAHRQMCLCSVILPLPSFNPSIARRRRGAFTLPPTTLSISCHR